MSEYNYLYKRMRRKEVKITPYTQVKIAYICREMDKEYKIFNISNFVALTRSQLLDKFEELVDNVDNPELVKKLSDKYDEHNKDRTYFCFPD
jgi:hypothetical protein